MIISPAEYKEQWKKKRRTLQVGKMCMSGDEVPFPNIYREQKKDKFQIPIIQT